MGHPKWMSRILWAAAAYNLSWGSWVVLRPLDLFHWTGALEPLYPAIWQCVGMIVGVYGIGYAIAARDPIRHWPITLVGLLGKILGPIGFAWMLSTTPPGSPGRLPLSWGWTIVTNDLLWWIPFAAILYQAARIASAPQDEPLLSLADANRQFTDQHSRSLADLSAGQTLLLVFLRHSGCTFCRETLMDLKQQREKLQSIGVKPVVIHMSNDADGEKMLNRYELSDLSRISDPACSLYRAYDLKRGRISQLLGPSVWWRGFVSAIVQRHGIGAADGDGFQMPGAFLVRDGRIIKAYRHQKASDRPDYCQLASSV
jgi:peroxiredoxin